MTTLKNDSGSIEQILADLPGKTGIKILSLDCFDTLFWRRVSEPMDLYAENGQNMSPASRIRCESLARRKKRVLTVSAEPTIFEIASEYLPGGTDEEKRILAESEIQAEKRVGFVFEPVVKALLHAKQNGIRTIVVSDTYYSSAQLRDMVDSVRPGTSELIDHIYCSCEHGESKGSGLWKTVLAKEKVKPAQVYHIGDNPGADLIAPKALGVTARHMLQNTEAIQSVLNSRKVPAKILFPEVGNTCGVPSYFHGWYAEHAHRKLDASSLVANTFLGPVMYAFGAWLDREVNDLQRQGKSVKTAFLYRDGYMLEQAYKAVAPEAHAAPVRISRFSSWAASFRDKDSVVLYLLTLGVSVSPLTVLDQLLLKGKVRTTLIERIAKSREQHKSLFKEVLKKEILAQIIKNSAQYRQRLFTYLKRETGLQQGDTLVLTDVGYDGTTQNTLQAAMEEELGIEVVGRYVISTPVPGWERNRRGLVDASVLDAKAVYAMIRHIAAFELFCSSHDQTVVDYTDSGEVVFGKSVRVPDQAIHAIQRVQHYAIDFVRHVHHQVTGACWKADDSELWRGAAIDLARFIYFPTREEIELLQNLQFEVNLGIEEQLSIVDVEAGMQKMRERGVGMLTNNTTMSLRTNFPAELRHAGMDYAVSLMTSHRLELRYSFDQDNFRTIDVPVMFVLPGSQSPNVLKARATFDGFYSLLIPNMQCETIVLLGKEFSLVQLASLTEIPTDSLYSEKEDYQTRALEVGREFIVDGATSIDAGIVQITPSGFLYLMKRPSMSKASVINLVFRPLCARQSESAFDAQDQKASSVQ